MKEYERNILAGYPVDIINIKQARGMYLCETDQGLYTFGQLHSSKLRIPYVQYVCQQIVENGFPYVPTFLPNEKGEFVSFSGDGTGYVLKRWFGGRECDVRKDKEILQVVEEMARLHLVMGEVSEQIRKMEEMVTLSPICSHFQGEHVVRSMGRHNQELKKVYRFICKRVQKDPLERLFLESFERVYCYALKVTDMGKESSYQELLDQELENRSLAHGSMNYHNTSLFQEGVAFTNFEHFRVDTQMLDLYQFMRKVLEKQNWNVKKGYQILERYNQVKPISDLEMDYLKLRLAYPEKFWKITNAYYNSNKAWFSSKNMEKLQLAVEEIPLKNRLLTQIFSFHL